MPSSTHRNGRGRRAPGDPARPLASGSGRIVPTGVSSARSVIAQPGTRSRATPQPAQRLVAAELDERVEQRRPDGSDR